MSMTYSDTKIVKLQLEEQFLSALAVAQTNKPDLLQKFEAWKSCIDVIKAFVDAKRVKNKSQVPDNLYKELKGIYDREFRKLYNDIINVINRSEELSKDYVSISAKFTVMKNKAESIIKIADEIL